MTVYSGVNYANTQASPIEQLDEGQYNAPLFKILDQFVLTADLVSADTILVGGPIPEGATLLNAKIYIPTALGTGSTLSLGWQATPTQPAGSLAGQAADPTGFFNLKAMSTAGAFSALGDSVQGDFYTQKPLTGQVQPVLTCGTGSTSATGFKIFVEIEYTDCA